MEHGRHINMVDTLQFLLTILFFIILLVIGALAFLFLSKKNVLPDLPVSLPNECHLVLGHAKYLDIDFLQVFGKICVDSATEDGLSSFFLLHMLTLNVIKSDHVKTVLNGSSYRDRVPLISSHFEMFLGRKSITIMMNEEWKYFRKMMLRAFHWEYLQSMVSTMTNISKMFAKSLLCKAGDYIDMSSSTKCVTLDIIGATSFGYNFNCVDTLEPTVIASSFDYMLAECTRRQFNDPFSPYSIFYDLPCEANRKFKSARKLLRSTLSEIINNRRNEMSDSSSSINHNRNDLLSSMIGHIMEEEKQNSQTKNSDKVHFKIDNEALADNLLTFLFGGYDTTSITLAYAFYCVSQHKDMEEKIINEINTVISCSGSNEPTYHQLQHDFVYCTAFIEEVLRLYPPAPLTVRVTDQPIVIERTPPLQNLNIPKGVQIYLPIWWIHRSELNFENPLQFQPDRFLPGNRDKIPKYGYIPFSGGARDCIGRRFAMLELLCVFICVMKEVRFTCDDTYVLNCVKAGVIQKPESNIILKIHPR
jgi:cytochrome P450